MIPTATKTATNRALSLLVFVFMATMGAYASGGAVNYGEGAGALSDAYDWVMTTTVYVFYAIEALGAMIVIYSCLQIYIKMQLGEQGVVKDIVYTVGACIFLLGASIVLPGFFGFKHFTASWIL